LTIVVLLFLASIWAAVLIPPVLRARAEGRPADSIGTFRRQLRVLESAGPVTVAPAHRLFSGRSMPSAIDYRPMPAALEYSPVLPHAGLRNRTGRASLARKRRRDVFLGLLSAIAGTAVLGLIPAFRALWTLNLILDGVFVGYVALLLYMRGLAAERAVKVRYLPGPGAAAEHALALRRAAN
jgi:hypothetical protein